jgi:tRNA 2-thiouridine synthesizing protein A
VSQPGDPSPIPDRVLDTIGLFCPVPIIKTAKAMKEMKAGEVLLLVSDDRGVLVDLPAWCRMAKEELVQMTEEAAIVRALVRKTDPARRSTPAAPPPTPPISS